jgi:8-oxo-dGTP pyrophosphatase MutT (NUDIX family)
MTDVPETTPPTAAPASKPRPLRPRDAATLIIVERGRGKIRVLMGKRHAGHKFMPGKFVFPGGAVEPGDRRMSIAGALDAVVEAKLLARTRRTSPEFARSLALAAIRETFEETGLALGVTDRGAPESPPEGAWTRFAATGVFPTLEGVDFLARAITPPGRVRRFDARFFVADAALIAHRGEGAVHPDAELVELMWIPIEKALELDIPRITRTILGDLAELGSAPPGRFRPRPFYRQLRAQSIREEL